METVHIFLTDGDAEGFADFVHDDARYVFDRLPPDGPCRVIEGPVHAFVDWVLDELSGLEMCRRLRADPRTCDAHITLLIEEDDPEHKRRALRATADDYVVGPLDRTMILDRVLTTQGRRMPPAMARTVVKGALEVDMAARSARWSNKNITLRPNEFRLLRFFAENSDRVLSRRELIAGLGKQDPPIDERTVDVWIGRLRAALQRAGAQGPIRTVRSLGYVFDSR